MIILSAAKKHKKLCKQKSIKIVNLGDKRFFCFFTLLDRSRQYCGFDAFFVREKFLASIIYDLFPLYQGLFGYKHYADAEKQF